MHRVIKTDEIRAQFTANINDETIIAAILFDADRQEVNHLRQSHGNHDEIDPTRSQGDSSKKRGNQEPQCRVRLTVGHKNY